MWEEQCRWFSSIFYFVASHKMKRNSTILPSSTSNHQQRNYQESNPIPSHSPPHPQENHSFRHFQSDLKIHSRIGLFRFLLAVSLVVSGALSATSSYLFIANYEDELYTEEFHSIVDDIYKSVEDGIDQKVDIMVHFSSLMGYLCPHSSNWPNCSVPSSSFSTLTTSLVDAGSSRSMGAAPLVRLDQKASFEKFAYDFFKTDGGYPNGTGYSSFGKGISKKVNGVSVPDLTGNNNCSVYSNIFFPIFEVSDIPNNYRGVMFNMHSEHSRSQAIDASMNCSIEFGSENLGHCTSITDVIQLVSDKKPSPASVMYTPIFPTYDNNSFVGVATLIFNWVELLTFDLPFGSSVYCILETKTVKHVFFLESNRAVYVGEDSSIDLSEKTDHFLSASRIVIQQADLLTTTEYKLKFIPHVEFYNQYHSWLPLIACVACLLIISIISIIFSLFDFFTKREAAKNVALLDSKRIFVRFISHEIRSPLNTIVLGLEVLKEKIFQLQQTKLLPRGSGKMTSPATDASLDCVLVGRGGDGEGVIEGREEKRGRLLDPSRTLHHSPLPNIVELISDISPSESNSSSLKAPQSTTGDNSPLDGMDVPTASAEYLECLEIIEELNENSEAAVVVLNDLINYDKIELKTFTIEKKEINLAKLIEKTKNSLYSQAKQKNIELMFRIDRNPIPPPPPQALPRSSSSHGSTLSPPLVDPFTTSQSRVVSEGVVGGTLQPYLINGDVVKLGQVFRNVISNALKLTPSEGRVSVEGTLFLPFLPPSLPPSSYSSPSITRLTLLSGMV
jgi:signal transduction histidine kinase